MYHIQTCTCPFRIALIPPLIVVVDIVVAVRKARQNRFVVTAHVVIVTIGPSCPQSQDIQRIGNLVAGWEGGMAKQAKGGDEWSVRAYVQVHVGVCVRCKDENAVDQTE
jgi:hypothetical protein